jgi:hypothetical protein
MANGKKSMDERLAVIETHVEYIRDNMANKVSISFLRWGLGGVATLALSALLIAAKAKGVY